MLLDYIGVIQTIVFLFIYLSLLVEAKWEKWRTIIFWGISLLLVELINMYLLDILGINAVKILNPVIVVAPAFVMSMIGSKYKDGRLIFSFLTAAAMNMAASCVADVIIKLSNSPLLTLSICLAVHIFLLLFVFKYLRLCLMEITSKIRTGWAINCVIPFGYYGIYYMLTTYPAEVSRQNNSGVVVFLLTFVFFMTYILIYRTFEMLIENFEIEQGKTVFNVWVKSMKKRDENVRKNEEETRIRAHDIRHYLNIIKENIKEGDIANAMVALEKMSGTIEVSKPPRCCTNPTINAILSYHIEEAEKNGIDISAKLMLPGKLPCDEFELAVLISNAVENAINACKKIDEKRARKIEITGKIVSGQLAIKIANTYEGHISFSPKDGLPLAEKNGHGNGSKSMLAFAEKYNAALLFDTENGWFIVRVIMAF